MNKLITFFVCCVFAQGLKAGNNPALEAAKNDIKRVNARYESEPNLSIDTYYMVYADHTTPTVLEGKPGKYVKFGKNYFTRVDDLDTYVIGNKIIAINPEDRMISVGDNTESTFPASIFNVDSLLELCRDVKLEQINAHERKYILFLDREDGGEFSRVDLQINTKELRFTRIVLFYTIELNLKSDFYAEEKAPRLEVTYKNEKQLAVQPAIFDESQYIVNSSNGLKPATRYHNYKLVDLRNQTRIKRTK